MTVEPDRVDAVARVTDHRAAGLARLTSQWQGLPVIEAVLGAWLDQIQAVEDALWSLLVDTTLETSTLAALDQLGRVVRQARPSGLGDEDYRTLLRAVILANRSRGRLPDLLAVASLLFGATAFTVTEPGRATVVVEPASQPSTLSTAVIAAVLRRAKAGGVRLLTIDVPAGSAFTFSPNEKVLASPSRGFGDIAQTTGGRFVGVIE